MKYSKFKTLKKAGIIPAASVAIASVILALIPDNVKPLIDSAILTGLVMAGLTTLKDLIKHKLLKW